MNRKIILRAGLLVLLAAVLGAMLLWAREPVPGDRVLCLGVPVLSEEDWNGLGSFRKQDHSQDLKFQGERAAVDRTTATVYLSCPIGSETTVSDLTGQLTLDLPGYSLYFGPDSRWGDLQQAVRDGHGFPLRVQSPWNTVMEYQVVFTTLPLLYIDGQYTYSNENDRNVFYGNMVLWDPDRVADGDEGINSGYLQWHLRGGSSSFEDKTPWKLSLKNGEGKNRNADLLGLGSDDDWILNPMNMEDTNVREMLFMELWNEMAARTDYNYAMSTGDYVEVVINGEYLGLFLLQRRVDKKYLDLHQDTILMKVNRYDSVTEYEFDAVPEEGDIPFDQMDAFYEDFDCTGLHRENFVDVSLFLQAFAATDNRGYKNVFYVWEKTDDQYCIKLIPWDTDMSLGSIWWDNDIGFDYHYEKSLQHETLRQEMDAMQALHPDLDRMLSRRWRELRQSLLTTDHLYALLDSWLERLEASGAVLRDVEKWGLFFDGEDIPDNLYRFLEERLALLDDYYAQ